MKMKKGRGFLFVMFFSFCLQWIFSENTPQGKAMSLKQIDVLIANTEYQQALDELSVYMKAYPRDFDRAQKRVEKILRARAKYDDNAEKLLNVMKYDNENDEQKMEIISELEDSEKNPPQMEVDFERQARRTVALGFYINIYNKIMKEGGELIKQEKYAEAAAKFNEGTRKKRSDTDKIYERDEEIPIYYDSAITDSVEQSLKRVDELVAASPNLYAECQSAYERFMSAVKRKHYEDALQSLPQVHTAFSKFAANRNAVLDEVKKISAIDDKVNEQFPLLLGTSYVSYSLSFVEEVEEHPETGVLGTMDTFFNTRIENMKGALYNVVNESFLEAKKSVPSGLTAESALKIAGNFKVQKDNISQSRKFMDLGPTVQKLYSLVKKDDGTPKSNGLHEYDDSTKFALNFADSLVGAISNTEGFADKNLLKFNGERIPDGSAADSEFIENSLEVARLYEKILRNSYSQKFVLDEYSDEMAYFAPKSENEKEPSLGTESGVGSIDRKLDFRDAISYYKSLNDSNMNEAQKNSQGIWEKLATIFSSKAKSIVDSYSARHSHAQELLDGVPETTGGISVIKKYPEQARIEAESLSSDIHEMQKTFDEWKKPLSAGESYTSQTVAYRAGIASLDESAKTLASMDARLRDIVAKAESYKRLAKIAADDAQKKYDRAENALSNHNYAEARNFLEQAGTKFRESLEMAEDPELRTKSDAMLAELGARIMREENEYVVREVRELMNKAQDDYYDGNFESAEKYLVRAQTRWGMTNTEENREIENLLEIVRTALNAKSGRILSPSDPLYSDMSQILTLSNQYFEEGEKLIKKGKRSEALEMLTKATEKIRALQQIYPLNQEAGLLTLRIEQLTSPESFKANFGKRVQVAASESNIQKRLAALQDLYKINPSYQGLEKQIVELEIAVGIRPRPVDNTAKNRSEELYAQAQAMYRSAGNNQAQLRQVLARLDEAIRMYGRNRAAQSLKDKIQSQIGGNAVAILTSADEQLYQQAVNYYTSSNFVMADKVLELLWEKPAAQQSAKIIDLRKRIKVRL